MHAQSKYTWLWRFFVLGIGALIVSYTTAPFEFTREGFDARLLEATLWTVDSWPETGCHILIFLVFGACLGRIYRAGALGGITIFSICIEVAQLLVPERHPRITDLLLNFGAGTIGICFIRRISFEISAGLGLKIPGVLCVFSLATWIFASAAPVLRLSLASWDTNARLVMGNELDGSEPWAGEIERIAVFSPDDAGKGSPTEWFRYDFRHKGVEAGGNQVNGINLARANNDPESALVSDGNLAAFVENVRKVNSFQVSAELGETLLSSNFAGRLISVSSSVSARNFMIGREGGNIVFRVRNRVMEENGRRNILIARGGLKEKPHSLIATYDHGFAAVYSGTKQLNSIDLRQPSIYLGLGGGNGGAASAGGLLGLFFAFPLFCILAFRALPFASIVAPVIALAIFALCFAVMHLKLRGPANLSALGISSVAIGLTYLVAHFYCAPNVSPLLRSVVSGSQNPRQEG